MYRDRLKGMQNLAGPRQGQAAQVSKNRNKLLATTYKPFNPISVQGHPCPKVIYVVLNHDGLPHLNPKGCAVAKAVGGPRLRR